MWVEDYQWHYDYVRLAWDTGFSFEKCKSPHLDKNKICVVDVDRIVKERDVASVDRYISTVVQYILDDEHAKVLDTNFVKIFRISQLAVEYLLFCKKYLDHTVVLLKKELSGNREENKQLKVYIEDLQAHIETLTKQHVLTTFKCALCSKVFSSEEYLNAHIKRRHSTQNTETYNSETDQLNMEIKELKERLNNTEKLLKENEQSPTRKLSDVNNDYSKMTEILEKFDTFKSHVENELKELRIQKSFYEENYGKLFDIVIQNKENIEPKNQIKETPKTETMTQTDKILQIENVGDKNIVNIKDLTPSNNDSDDKNEGPQNNAVIAAQAHKESLEARISATLAGIESQMQAFWNKLNEIEHNNTNATVLSPVRPNGDHHKPANNVELDSPNEIVKVKEAKPKAKPRSKLTQSTTNATNNAEKLRMEIEKLEQRMKAHEILVVQDRNGPCEEEDVVEDNKSDENSYSESESSVSSESDGSDTPVKMAGLPASAEVRAKYAENMEVPENQSYLLKDKEKAVAKHPAAAIGKHCSTRSKNETPSKKIVSKVTKEMEEIICGRLQGLGISENWTRLPERSFDKALEIINHQAELSKKTYPNFSIIRSKLNSEVEKQCCQKKPNKSQSENGSKSSKLKKLQNIVKVSYRPTSGRKKAEKKPITSPKREIIEIKNRALYETDTDSDESFKQRQKKPLIDTRETHGSHRMYSSVVKELKSIPHVKSQTDEDLADDINKDEQKGVLKSFPSAGSLSKKKVLFDLDSDSSQIEEPPVIMKAGGSTTSIASSILGEKVNDAAKNKENAKEKSSSKNNEKELDDLSDFDLSDI